MKQLIREIIPVIIGILVALVINNWNEDRKEKKYLNQIFTSIEKELEISRKDLEKNIPKEQILIDSIGKYLNDATVSIFEIIRKADGIYGANVKNSSWKAIANSKIELVDFEKLSALSEINESKESLELKREKQLDFMINNLKASDQEKKEIFMLLNQEILSTEKYLLLEFEEFLKKY